MRYDPDAELTERPTSVPFGEYMARYLRDDDDFMAGVRRGLKAVREGKVRPWAEIRKELGLDDPGRVGEEGDVLRQGDPL